MACVILVAPLRELFRFGQPDAGTLAIAALLGLATLVLQELIKPLGERWLLRRPRQAGERVAAR